MKILCPSKEKFEEVLQMLISHSYKFEAIIVNDNTKFECVFYLTGGVH